MLGQRFFWRSEARDPARRNRHRSIRCQLRGPEPLEARALLDGSVVFNEIHYHPAGDDSSLEFVELENQMAIDMDLSGWRLDGGIEFAFPESAVIPGRGFLVVAADPAALAAASGFEAALGPFSGQLSNGGETLRLLNMNDRRINVVDYRDDAPWPAGPDGSGATLARRASGTGSQLPENWTSSVQVGGTPGAENFPDPDAQPPIQAPLVQVGAAARVLVPTQAGDVDVQWPQQTFDDQAAAGWFDAVTGIGFDTTDLLDTAGRIDPQGDIEAIMSGQNATALVRTPFEVDDPDAFDSLNLDIEFDDGFVAYLNGTEVARRNAAAGSLPWNANAADEVPAGYEDVVLRSLGTDISAPVAYWRLGEASGSAPVVNSGAAGSVLNGFQENSDGALPGLVDDDDLATSFNGLQSAAGTVITGSGLNSIEGGNPLLGDWTIEAWLVHDSTQSWSGVFSNNAGTTGSPLMTFISTTNQLGVNGAGITANNVSVDLGPDHFGKPVYAVITKTGGNASGQADFSVYVNLDGTWLDTATGTNNGWNLTAGDGYYIGRHYAPQHQQHDGLIDEVAVYDRALSVEEIENHFLASGRTANNTLGDVPPTPPRVTATEQIDLTSQIDLLTAGTNVLAIHGLNVTATDDDFLIRPELTATLRPEPPDPARGLVINELTAANDASFFVEVANPTASSIDVEGLILRSTAVLAEDYLLPALSLEPGGLLAISRAELGFDAAIGDRLFLFTRSGEQLIDARAADDRLRGRSPDHDGDWLYPAVATPGQPNQFDIEDAVVINEIMYHPHPQLAVPEVVEQRTLVDLTGSWRYDQSGTDLGTAWREVGFDDAGWSTGSAILSSATSLSYVQTVLDDQPVGYWRLGEPAGASVAANLGSAGTTLDANYQSFSATGAGLVGDDDTAADFDGVQAAGGTHTFGTGLDTLPGGNPFAGDWTIEAWLVHDATRQWSGVFSNNAGTRGSPLLTFIDNTNQLGINAAGISPTNVSVDLGPDHFGKPIYAVITKSGDNAAGQSAITMHANVDGQWLDPATGTASWDLTTGDGFYIGRHWASGTQMHDGLLDEIAIYDYALADDQIAAHYSAARLEILTPLAENVPTQYFRTTFGVNVDPTQVTLLALDVIVDDGAVFYVNGVEAYRHNMPAGPIGFLTSAQQEVSTPRLSGPISIPADALVPGQNVLAVEVHQFAGGAGDVTFGTGLEMTLRLSEAREFAESTLEWLELYNQGSESVELTGWSLADAVEYQFAPGTSIASGGFLVVAKDAIALSSLYGDITIVGNYSGTLSNRSERVLLTDAHGNPADEVLYFDSGRWPQAADGGGASLELRDPASDNSRAEAWAASDEDAQSSWQTFTVREVASADVGPLVWNEFVLGLLDAGEVLIDDVSVIEDPAGTARELIQNGSFDSGIDKWRVIGNHRAQIVPDPDAPTNPVLHLIATGPTEHQHNHAETTFLDNTPIANGTEYEISFRAKWLAGSSQLNGRFYLSRVAETYLLGVPPRNGTPGAANSTRVANVGPTYSDLSHSPAVPAAVEDMTVEVRSTDPDGVASMTLWWRVEGSGWNTIAMSPGTGDVYHGTIPGQPAATIVQFYVQGQDASGASSTFPAAGPDSRALIKISDGQGAPRPIDTFRLVMTTAEADALFVGTELMSNQFVGATVVVNEADVFYDVGVRLKGSPFGRADTNRQRSFRIDFHPDQLFRGVYESIALDGSGRSPLVSNGQDEILVNQLMNHAGGYVTRYDDLAHMIAPHSRQNGPVILQLASYGNDFLDERFNNGSDGSLFEFEIINHATQTVDGDPESLKTIPPPAQVGTDIRNLGDDTEDYRWSYLIKNNRDRDDYSRIIEMAQSFDLAGAALDDATQEILDVDWWMRKWAMTSLVGQSDVYSVGAQHNIWLYVRPEDNKVLVFPWDVDSVFARATNASLYGGGNLAKIVQLPANLRLFYGHLHDVIDTTFNETYVTPWAEHLGGLVGQDFSPHVAYIRDRAAFVLSQLPAEIAFTITTPGPLNVGDASLATIEGDGWINVRQIRRAGSDLPLAVNWTDSDSWSLDVSLVIGENEIALEAYDFQGNLVGVDTIRVTTAGDNPYLDFLQVSEVMYNPADPTPGEQAAGFFDNDVFEFIEFYNSSTQTPLDLTGVRILEGPSTEFHFAGSNVTALAPGEFVLVVANQIAFQTRYGGALNDRIAGEYSGGLSNGGEDIVVVDPGGAEIHNFTYGDAHPWPAVADGYGFSIVLKRPGSNPEHSDPLRWRGSGAVGGSPGAADVATQAPIVINEILTHTDAPDVDRIELFNPTGTPVGIGGWFLTDNLDIPRKYTVPPGSVVPADGYFTLAEDDDADPLTIPGADYFGSAFSLSALGEELYLFSGDGVNLTGHEDSFEIPAALGGESFGRWTDGDGDLYPMRIATFGQTNSGPRIGPLTISEIMYNPPDPGIVNVTPLDLKFVEIHNPTAASQDLSDWEIGGIGYTLPTSRTIGSGETLVILPFDPSDAVGAADAIAAFQTVYGVDVTAGERFLGPFSGTLSGAGERITLWRADEEPAGMPGVVPLVIEERVDYAPSPPWPVEPDGTGPSLTRVSSQLWSADAASWTAAAPSPGAFDNQFIPLQIAGVDATPSGAVIHLTGDVELAVLNLYDGPDAPVDLADVTFVGESGGPVSGSLVWSAAPRTLHFVATGDPLPPDDYTLTLAGRTDGLIDSQGQPLDGDADGNPGGDFTTPLTVGIAHPVVVSLPDFTRGPGQPVDVPPVEVDDGDDTPGLPLRLSEAAGVTSVTLNIGYDPALLTITDAAPGPAMPVGAVVVADTSIAGVVGLRFTSPQALSAGPVELMTLNAHVPAAAMYGGAHVLDVSALSINGGAIAATADDALHAAAYLGDATGNGSYSGLDAQRVARVAVHLDTGFDAFPRIDPVVIADATGNGVISGLDAQRIAQEAAAIDPPEIPPIPQTLRLPQQSSRSRETSEPSSPTRQALDASPKPSFSTPPTEPPARLPRDRESIAGLLPPRSTEFSPLANNRDDEDWKDAAHKSEFRRLPEGDSPHDLDPLDAADILLGFNEFDTDAVDKVFAEAEDE